MGDAHKSKRKESSEGNTAIATMGEMSKIDQTAATATPTQPSNAVPPATSRAAFAKSLALKRLDVEVEELRLPSRDGFMVALNGLLAATKTRMIHGEDQKGNAHGRDRVAIRRWRWRRRIHSGSCSFCCFCGGPLRGAPVSSVENWGQSEIVDADALPDTFYGHSSRAARDGTIPLASRSILTPVCDHADAGLLYVE